MTVMHAMLGNAAVAAVLALLALAVGRVCRSPSVRHVAWVLVLLKLIMPPLISVPLPVLPAPPAENPNSEIRNPKEIQITQTPNPKPAGVQVSDIGVSGLGFVSGFGFRIWDFALGVWAGGAVVWFVWQCRRIVRFRRRVARAEDAGPEVAAA